MQSPRVAVCLITVAAFSLLIMSCGGGGGSSLPAPNPNPNPGTQQPAAQSPVPAESSFIFGLLNGTQIKLLADPGTFEPGASVEIIDGVGTVAQFSVPADGSLDLSDGDFPPAFDRSVGNTVMMTQTAPGMTESPAVALTLNTMHLIGI